MTPETPPLVSVLLLTCDAGPSLSTLLDVIRRQDVAFQFEIVAVDSRSTDGTRERLERAGVRVISIARSDFNHGSTRNLGMAECRGQFVVMLVQDAVPDSGTWLASLVAPMLEDGTIWGSYARQVAPGGSSSVARAYLSGYAASSSRPRIQTVQGREAFSALSPAKQLDLCTFDNVCSCVRKSAWEDHPFPRTPIAEDVEWARDVILAGGCLAFVPEARVRHLHDRPAAYELRRTYLVHRELRRLFGLRTVPSVFHLARSIAVSVLSHARWVLSDAKPWRRKAGEMPRAVSLAIAFPLGQYLGAKSADTGREFLRVRGV